MANGDLNQYIKTNDGLSQKSKLLEQQRAATNRSLEQQKKQEQQAASIRYQKLMKYLPEYQKSMGLKGNGMSETALLDAAAQYRSEQGRINSEYSSRQDAVNEQYRQNLLDLYSQAEAQMRQDEETLKQDQLSAYTMAVSDIGSWSGSSEDLTKYYNDLKGKISDQQYDSLSDKYNTMLKTIQEEEAIAEIKVEDIPKGLVTVTGAKLPDDNGAVHDGDNIQVSDGNKTYYLELGGAINSGDAWQAAQNSNVADGDIFMYDDQIYYRQGTTVRLVRKRAVGDQRNYDNLKALLTGNTAKVNATSAPQSENKQSGNKSTSTNGMVARRMNGI